jgi:hypothetical protein
MSKIEEVKELRLTIEGSKIKLSQSNLSYVEIVGLLDLATIQVKRQVDDFYNDDKDNKDE